MVVFVKAVRKKIPGMSDGVQGSISKPVPAVSFMALAICSRRFMILAAQQGNAAAPSDVARTEAS